MNWNTIPSDEVIQKTANTLKTNGISPIIVASGKEAQQQILSLIPQGSSVMNGASQTLEQIGFVDYLKSGKHGWNNLHEAILAEKDPAKQAELRKQSVLSDYYVGSVHALTQTGEILIASNTGSQLPHIVFTSQNLLFIVGAQKIVPTLNDAMTRLEEHVVPLEDKRMQKAYGVNTQISKIVLFKKENPMMGRNVMIIIVKESLGF